MRWVRSGQLTARIFGLGPCCVDVFRSSDTSTAARHRPQRLDGSAVRTMSCTPRFGRTARTHERRH
ncbi:MAG: hypothetical protein NZ898_15390 [Myxococcota bacterium]|nr:hypothetical protein [Myxococcota bacterium]MDW8361547.1 hypothetical protein [Myxococcales bacterium]